MKTTRIFILRNSLLAFATLLLAFSGTRVSAQTADAQSSTAQAASAATGAPVIKPVARITQAIDEAKLATAGSVHPLAQAAFDQGLVPDSRPMPHMLLVLQRSPEQESALRNLLNEQQTAGSANYKAWLTPAQFAQQFGVASSDIQQITSWLAQKGFTDIKASNGGMFIDFSGTAGSVRNAFHTEIHNVMVNGELHIANMTEPQIPAALAPVVAKIHSLHDFRLKSYMHLSQALALAKTGEKPHSTFPNPCGGSGQPACFFAVGPGDLATIYNIPATVAGSPAGTGQTVAIVARSNITVSDINQFGSIFGIPNLTSFSYANNVIVNGPDPGVSVPDDGEATLDIDMVGSAAPNANILLVVNGGTLTGNLAGLTQPTDGVDQSALYIVDNNLAPVMTQSFGACEFFVDTLFNSTLWEQAAAQGISVFVSTGDSGSDSCDEGTTVATGSQVGLSLTVSGAASTPFNIAVGGTDFNDASNIATYWNSNTSSTTTAKSYIPEIPWNDSCATLGLTGCTGINPDSGGLDLTGGSGGQSSCGVQNVSNNTCTGYPKPSWQSAPGMPADSLRDIPDVSLFASVNSASNHFYVFCLADSGSQTSGVPCNLTTGNVSGVGGTSASTPAWAGIMALVNQSELAAGRGGRQGNANYVLYKLATAQGTTPGTSACAASSAAPNPTCTFNDVTTGNNSVECVAGSPNCSNQTANGFGVLVEPSSPSPFTATTPGWTATAGYDLATGLGSPNVSNLIANWPTVTTNFKSATPAITSTTPATLTTTGVTHGASATFNISVTGASGTPTGDVSLIAEPPGFSQVGVGSGTLSNGTATITTNMLPGDDTTGAGTPYPVVAHYAGDGTFGPADSAPLNVTVNRENSTTTGTVFTEDIQTNFLNPATTIQYGTNYIMIVNVVGATAGTICNNSSPLNPNQPPTITEIPTVPCPTGTITLKDNGSPLNDFPVTLSANANSSSVGNLGFVEDLLIQLLGGSQAILSTYSGDNSYNASSSTNTVTVATAPTQTTVTGPATASTGQTVALVATVNTTYMQGCGQTQTGQTPPNTCTSASNGVGPTGTVTFKNGATTIGTAPVVGTAFNSSTGGAFGTATLNTSFSAAGTETITATYGGDSNYSPCTSAGGQCTITSLSVTVSGSVSSATKLAFIAQPSNASVGIAISPAVQVAVEDTNGNIVSTAINSISITASTSPSCGTAGGTSAVNASGGIATFSNLTLSAAGAGCTLTASATGLTSATSTTFNVVLQPSKLVFITQPTNAAVAATIIPNVQVAIEDANGNVIAQATNNVTVAIGTNPGSGTLGGTVTAAASGGIATFNNLSVSAAGTGYTLKASATGLTGATSTAFNVIAAATKLAFTVQPANSFTGKSIAPAVQVAIEDTNGNIVGGATTPITMAIGTNPATATLGGTATVNPAAGVATFSNLTISAAGTGYTLTATATGLTSATSTTFNVTTPPTPAFTVSYPAQPTTLSSSTGAAAGTTITVTPSGGFTGNVAVTATAATLPPGVSCTNSPLTINVTGTTAVSGTLNCQVTASSTTLSAANIIHTEMLEAKAAPLAAPAPPNNGGTAWWALSAGSGFAALFLFFLPRGGRKRLHAALGLGLICILSLTLGCSGNGNGGGGGGPVATTTAMKVNADKEAAGTAFTFNVTVTGGTPTGMAQLFDGGTAITTAGASAAVSGGTANLTWTPTAAASGTHAISVHYLGDSKTMASQSGTLNLTVQGSTTIAVTTSPAATPAAGPINITVQ